jgi:hypothetical protein
MTGELAKSRHNPFDGFVGDGFSCGLAGRALWHIRRGLELE